MSDLIDVYQMTELRALRTRLAAVERERDDLVDAVVIGPLKGKTANDAIIALRGEVAELLASADADALMLTQVGRERDAAVQRAADIERATVVGIVAWLDDVEGSPIGDGTLRDFGLQDYANRVDAFRELFAGALRAGAWRGKEAP